MFVVTGPTGNVGSELAARLTEPTSDIPYRLVSRDPSGIADRFGPSAVVERLDFTDRQTWHSALDGVTTLFLLFPLPHPRTAKRAIVPFVSAAVEAGAGHIVYVTVPGADSNRIVPHHAVEQAIRSSGATFTFLRCAYFSQNLVRALSTHGVDIAEHDEVYLPARNSVTTFLDARDVADATVTIVSDLDAHTDATYTLAGPEALTFSQVAEILADVLERPIRYTDPSVVEFWRHMRRRGLSRDKVLFMEVVYRLARQGLNAPVSDDLTKLLGKPGRTFREFAVDNRWRWEQRAWT